MTELTNIEQKDFSALAARLGAESSQTTASSRLPELKIMSLEYDANENKIEPDPRGKFFLKSAEEAAYAETATFRPLSHHYQWIHFDENELKNKSRMITSFREEARDILGGIKCGYPPWESMQEMERDERKHWRDMQYRQVRGLVSMTGTTVSGKEVEVVNRPCILMLRNSNYSGFKKQVLDGLPKERSLFDFNIELSSTRNKNGNVVWYTFDYSPDFENPLERTEELFDSLEFVADMVDEENKRIDKAYFRAVAADSIESSAVSALENALDADMSDAAA